MTFISRAAPLLIGLLLMLAGPAAAQQPWPVLAKMGLGGTWAASCSAGPSESNWFHTYYVDAKGQARRRAERGGGLPDLNLTIESSQYLTPTTFAMRMRNDDAGWGESDGTVYDVIVEITSNTLRSLSSTRIGDGKQLIKDGKFTASGNPVRAYQRCR